MVFRKNNFNQKFVLRRKVALSNIIGLGLGPDFELIIYETPTSQNQLVFRT